MNFLQDLTMTVLLECQRLVAGLQTDGISDSAREATMDSYKLTCLLFVFLALQLTVVVFSQPVSRL
jgi:hypothetical protein